VKKLLAVLVVIGLALVGGVAWYEGWFAGGPIQPERDEFKPLPARKGRVVELVNAAGTVQPLDPAVVTSELAGRVVHIFPRADFNQEVEAGEPLVQLDDRLARQKLAQAELAIQLADANVAKSRALLDAAQINYHKQLELLKRNVGQEKDRDKAEMELKAAQAVEEAARIQKQEAEAARKLAQLNLDLTTVRAPISGTVIDKKVVIGQALSPLTPTPLFTIVPSLKRMQVQAQVAEGDIGRIRVGLPVSFTVQDYSDPSARGDGKPIRFDGKITQVRSVPVNVQGLNIGAVFYPVVAEVDNQWDSETGQWRLRPGMSVNVDIVRREHQDVWLVPIQAVDLVLDEHYQTAEARTKIEKWDRRLEAQSNQDWRRIWILDERDQPWPAYIRIGGTGETALKGASANEDAPGVEYQEVLEWDPDPVVQARLRPGDPARLLEVITQVPVVQKRGWFQAPRMPKLF
jgi:HlyD family secretion protein